MLTVDGQPDLPLARRPVSVDVPFDMIAAKRSSAAAFTLACDASGLDDKEISMSLGIDPGYFSRIKKGQASLDADKIRSFCALVGNTIYPQWIAYQVGCGIVMLKTEAERRAEAAESRAIEAEKKLEWALQVLQGRVST